ncbi:hypothetical protein ElyMa_001177200 [Elysia marginata]|uniref:SMB domain-containing protein n=1 Tax=Elysia marginata TaxID=1093978 RepID=A0AAV4I3J8_9GAST|nr:hypothetical protein ElyMa_001177200 [Elysia marginata]
MSKAKFSLLLAVLALQSVNFLPMAACEDSKQSIKTLISDTGTKDNMRMFTRYVKIQTSTISTDAWKDDTTERYDFSNLPWFFKALPNGTGAVFNTSWSQHRSSSFDRMLRKLMDVHLTIDSRMSLAVDTNKIYWEATTEMAEMLFEQSLCSRDDIVRRTSCTGRCGEQSDTRASPGQCSCDSDCFLFGDCCEDMNMLCPLVFIDAVKTFDAEINRGPPQECTIPGANLLSNLLTLEHELNLVESSIFEIYCDLEGFKQTALQDISLALVNSKCVSSALTRYGRPSSRSCARPDVLLCESYRKKNFYSAFPVHLQCFDHRLTYSLLERFDILGINGMETISKHGQCRLLRLPSTGRNSDDLDINSQVWTSKTDVLKLMGARSLNMTFFDFQNDNFGKIRCTGTGNTTDLKCTIIECPNRHLLDKQSQTCFRPERVIFQVFGTKTKTSETCDKTGTTLDDSGTSNETSSPVSVCLCLKTHSVMKNLGWWRVMDKVSLLEGRCELRFFGYQTVSNLAANEEEDELPTEEAVTVRADDLGENSLDIPTRASEYTVVEEKNFSVSNYFSEQVLKIWRNEAQRCSSEEHSLAARWCFSGSKSFENYETCFSWRRRPANVKNRCDECLISSYSSSARSAFGVYRRSWYKLSRYIIAVLIQVTHTVV